MATTKFLYENFRFTVIRRNDGSIEIKFRRSEPEAPNLQYR